MKIKCFTSFSFSYLTRAIVFAQTLRAAHPDWEISALLVDLPPEGLDVEAAMADFDHIIYVADLGIPSLLSWLFKHDVVEACTAVKGQMLSRLLASPADAVIYFDPDIAIFHPLTSVLDRLNDASIILTPHQTDANERDAAVRDNELIALKYGIFNLGFLAVRNDETGRRFAAWWAKLLHFACYDDVESGIFTDQKWCDLVPALFDRVFVERDPGCNVASWNLSTRSLSFTKAGNIMVNDSPLKFYHYTKINAVGDIMIDKYGGDNIETYEVWNWYKRALGRIKIEGIPSGYWHYGQFSDGHKIPKRARILFRQRQDLYAAFTNPFEAGEGSYHHWLQREHPEFFSEKSGGGFEAI